MSISVKNLFFKYSKSKSNILSNINIDIRDNSINVLLGLNGCGKTTLIKILAGLYEVNDGKITYNGVNIKDLSILERSRVFSYVPQNVVKAEDYKVNDYLTYGFVNSLKFYESPKAEQIRKIKDIAKKVNITHLLDKRMGELSGGEKQIVIIISCLLQNTPVILLDEPMSSLDLKNQNVILTLLKIIKDDKKTIILSTHNPNHSLFLDANVILMNQGCILEYGRAKDIIIIDKLKTVYGSNICLSTEHNYNEISFK